MESFVQREEVVATYVGQRKVVWGAVFAGVVVALMLGVLLNLLSLGLGFSAFKLSADSAANIGMSAVVWLVISSILSMIGGGWVAGRLAGTREKTSGFLHGILVWSLATFLGLTLMSTAVGGLVSGTISLLGKGLVASGAVLTGSGAALTGAAQSDIAQQALPDLTPAITQIKDQVLNYVKQTEIGRAIDQGTASPEQVRAQISQALAQFLNNEDNADARTRLVNLISQATNMSTEEVNQKIDEWKQAYDDLKQKAQEVTETTVNTLGYIALASFFSLLIGALSAGFSSMRAANQPDVV